MLALFWRTIKDRKFPLLAYCGAGILFLWLYVALFPFMQEQAEKLSEAFKSYPEPLLKAFGIEAEQLLFTKLENFLAVEHFSLVWPIMLFAMLIAWGGSAIAGEIEKDTIETLLAQPLSRVKIFLSKYLAGVAALLIFIVTTTISVFPLAAAYKIDYQTSHYLTIGILGFLLGLAIFSISIFFSSIFSEKGKAYFISAGIIMLMYVVHILSTLKESLSDLKYLSFFHYYNSNDALINNQIEPLNYWVFLGVSMVFTFLAVVWFSKRNIAV